MSKHWTELSREAKNEIRKFRELFLREHEKADEILMSPTGIPLKAIYFSPELPGYGKTYDEVPMPKREMKDVER